LINSMTGNPTTVDLKPARGWDRSGRRFGSPTKSREMLGFEAKVPMDEGLRITIDWTIQNREHIKKCIERHDRFVKMCT